MLLGLAVAAAVTLVAVVYPLWVQFAGRQHVAGSAFSPDHFSADVVSFVTLPRLSLFGDAASAAALGPGPTEENAFLGWPLLLLTGGCAAALWPRPAAKAATTTALVFALLSFGPTVILDGRRVAAGPFRLVGKLPLVEAALPVRFALVVIPLIGLLVALALHEAWRLGPRLRVAVGAAVTAALVPIVPVPLPTIGRVPVPEFVSSGRWRECTRPGGTLVPVPLPTPAQPEAMRWAAAARAEFALPRGFFIGPYGANGGPSVGIFPRPTALLLEEVQRDGVVPPVGAAELENIRQDLRYWQGGLRRARRVRAAAQQVAEPMLRTVTSLLGPPVRIADAWVWDVPE